MYYSDIRSISDTHFLIVDNGLFNKSGIDWFSRKKKNLEKVYEFMFCFVDIFSTARKYNLRKYILCENIFIYKEPMKYFACN